MDNLVVLIILAVIFLLFGKSIVATAETTFSQPNAVPTPDGIPAATTQNQNIPNTANAPAPWQNSCTANTQNLPASTSLPFNPGPGQVTTSIPLATPVKGTVSTVTFQQ